MMELGVVSKNLLATEATQATQGQTASVMTLVGFGLIGTALFVSHSFRFTTDKYTAYRKRQKDADRNTWLPNHGGLFLFTDRQIARQISS